MATSQMIWDRVNVMEEEEEGMRGATWIAEFLA